ncbi:hypothetical protein M758_UG027800 [Ceratodon purpureus]|nr:hypothetical protein M758_UG027800 [Ceratodon purpureus]
MLFVSILHVLKLVLQDQLTIHEINNNYCLEFIKSESIGIDSFRVNSHERN